MNRSNGPTYNFALPLKTTKKDDTKLTHRLHVSNCIYNAVRDRAVKIINKLWADKEYDELAHKKDKTKEDKERLEAIRKEYGFTEFDMNKYAAKLRHNYPNSVDVHEAQNQAHAAFLAAEKYLYGKGGEPERRHLNDPKAMTGKMPDRGIIFKEEKKGKGKDPDKTEYKVKWNGLDMKPEIARNNLYVAKALMDETKYASIVGDDYRGRIHWSVRIYKKGIPPQEAKKHPERIGKGRVGIDLSQSVMFTCSPEGGPKLEDLDPNDRIYPPDGAHLSEKRPWKEYRRPIMPEREKRIQQRKMNRSSRANNPQNYNEDGTIKRLPKGEKRVWNDSNTYKKTRGKYHDNARKERLHRHQGHCVLAKDIIQKGDDIIAEKTDYRALARRAKKTTVNPKNGRYNSKKRHGKTIGQYAPGELRSLINQKLGYFGKSIYEIDPRAIRASQFCHVTGEYVKKQLYERWNRILGMLIQRDMYSAFLLMCVTASYEAVDIERCSECFPRFIALHDKEVERIRRSYPSGHRVRWFVK